MSSTLGLSVQVSRPSGGPLELNDNIAYAIADGGLGDGPRILRRETTQSAVASGRVLLSAVEDVRTLTLKVRVYGASIADLLAKIGALQDAMSQWSYTIQVAFGTTVSQWRCEPADWAVGSGGSLDAAELRGFQQLVTFTIPRAPQALAGVL